MANIGRVLVFFVALILVSLMNISNSLLINHIGGVLWLTLNMGFLVIILGEYGKPTKNIL